MTMYIFFKKKFLQGDELLHDHRCRYHRDDA